VVDLFAWRYEFSGRDLIDVSVNQDAVLLYLDRAVSRVVTRALPDVTGLVVCKLGHVSRDDLVDEVGERFHHVVESNYCAQG